MYNNIQELIAGFQAPVTSFYYLLTHLNYRMVGEFLFAVSFLASFYVFCYCWVYFCIKISEVNSKGEKENKWISKK